MKEIKHVRHEADFPSRKRKYMLFFVNKDLLSETYCLLHFIPLLDTLGSQHF